MNRLFIILLSFSLLPTFSAHSQGWIQQKSPNTKGIISVAFNTPTNGFAVGQLSNFLYTSDGGNNWQEMEGAEGIGQDLWAIDFPNTSYGYVAGTNGVILRTSDAGAGWNFGPTPTDKDILKMDFASASTGIMVGEQGLVIKTDNWGDEWYSVTPSYLYTFTAVFMLNNSVAWVGGSSGVIYKTTTGGSKWVAQNSGTTETIWDIKFVDANNGYATATRGKFLITKDGGNTWTAYTVGNYTNNLFNVHFDDLNNGWLIGQAGLILKTTNGGNNWTKESVPAAVANTNLIDITKAGSQMYIVGTSGTILKYSATFLELTSPNGKEKVKTGNVTPITWKSQNVQKVNIYFSVNGGVEWVSIAKDIDAAEGSYNWTVPNFPTLTAKVKIENADDASSRDESNEYFAIVDASGIDETMQQTSFTTYPNPNPGKFVIRLNNSNKAGIITITNIAGQLIHKQAIPAFADKIEVDLPQNITNGLYFVNFNNSEQQFNARISVIK